MSVLLETVLVVSLVHANVALWLYWRAWRRAELEAARWREAAAARLHGPMQDAYEGFNNG